MWLHRGRHLNSSWIVCEQKLVSIEMVTYCYPNAIRLVQLGWLKRVILSLVQSCSAFVPRSASVTAGCSLRDNTNYRLVPVFCCLTVVHF